MACKKTGHWTNAGQNRHSSQQTGGGEKRKGIILRWGVGPEKIHFIGPAKPAGGTRGLASLGGGGRGGGGVSAGGGGAKKKTW